MKFDRILIIRPSALGDVCRTVPVLASLRQAFPAACIDWLVQDAFAPAIQHHPALSGVVPFSRARFGLGQLVRRPGRGLDLLRLVAGLAKGRYDLVLDAQGLLRSGLFAAATLARRRVGYADAREGAWLALTDRVPAPRTLHSVDRMLKLVEHVGATPVADMRLYADPVEVELLGRDAGLGGAGGSRYVLIAPTSRWAGKQWPAERFAELTRRLLEDRTLGLDAAVLVGGAGERGQIAPLLDLAASEPRVLDRVGTTSVAGLTALVSRAALVVANDSAPLHMAVGFDRPLVGLYGPTDVALVGPYRRERWVIQHVEPSDRLDHKDDALGTRLMRRIGIDETLERAREALSAAAQATEPGRVAPGAVPL